MKIRAKESFGGIVSLHAGEIADIDKKVAMELVRAGLAEDVEAEKAKNPPKGSKKTKKTK